MGLLDGLKKAMTSAGVASGAIDTSMNGPPEMENAALIKQYEERVVRINAMEDAFEKLSDEELRAKTTEFQRLIREGKEDVTGPLLEEAFAVVREAAWRVLQLRHYDVQLMGGMALNEGRLAEMATGEGKTLVATLPAYLNGLTGNGAFLVTANDYLARRDAELMGQVHRFLGLSVGLIQTGMTYPERREAYACDVTYVTNVELGFDYLRDNLALTEDETVLRARPLERAFCLVDEADSILIDEARTPLIISKQINAPQPKYGAAKKLVDFLKPGVHYEVDEKAQNVVLTDQGVKDCEKVLGKSLFDLQDPWMSFVTNGLKAKELLTRDKDYIVRGQDIAIVDRFSGRVLEGRKYSDGLQQSIQIKEGLSCSSQSQVIATITYQSLFRLFYKLAGMTGTALTDYKDFVTTYNLPVVAIPTALPNARKDYPDAIFRSKEGKLRALLRETRRAHKTGQPILIGTTSVETSELIADALQELNISCKVLNARPENIEKESQIVAQAGRLGAVTVATNMAGRGTDILLGGNPALMARIKLKLELARGVLGSQAGAEAMDDFFPVEVSPAGDQLIQTAVALAKEKIGAEGMSLFKIEEMIAVAAENSPVTNPVLLALRDAYDEVKRQYQDVLADEKVQVKRLGGLYVLGTERHESRRIDNQLRGRAGRQGDSGATRFFLSLEDDVFRIFGGDKIQSVMDTFRVGDDLPIESPTVSEALDKVQQQVESYYFDIRQKLLAFDNVISKQRQELYEIRAAIVAHDAAQLHTMMRDFARQTTEDIVDANFETEKRGKIVEKVRQFFPTLGPVDDKEIMKMTRQQTSACMHEAVDKTLERKKADLATHKAELYAETVRYLTLLQIDNLWAQQLEALEQLKEISVLQRFKGADPMLEYEKRTSAFFRDLIGNVRRNTVYSLFQYQPKGTASGGGETVAK
jgi:preprotein translocase subunit SecA